VLEQLFTICGALYICIYACEGPIRLFLHQHGADDLILLRDLLIFFPLAVLFLAQALRTRIHPGYLAFVALMGLHGAIIYAGQRTYLPVIYGCKIYINLLFGFLAARQLCQPGRRVTKLLSLVWLVSVVGLLLDKYVYDTMPWVGIEQNIGGIQVDVARDWFISGADKRAGGLMRSSIFAAELMPLLTIVLACKTRNYLLRAALLGIGLFAVLLTTQKGALGAMAAVAAILLLSTEPRRQYKLLCSTGLLFALLAVSLPVFSINLLVDYKNDGPFSVSSLLLRIGNTWPDAWRWIARNEIFPFGVGLGGIGGPQRFYAQDFFNPADNVFIYLYANFGLLALFYIAWLLRQMFVPSQFRDTAIVALAIVVFQLGDGIVLSVLEDQMASLFIGAAAGMLWQLHQRATNGAWVDPYHGGVVDRRPAAAIPLGNLHIVRGR
jgi:hypothetical protein